MEKLLKEYYGIEITTILSLKGGWASLAYKVINHDQSYFLKVYEKSRASTPKLTERIDEYVPIMGWLIRNGGLNGKTSTPLLTKGGDYKCEDDNGVYLLYDYIDGETIGHQELTENQIYQLSEIIANLHLYGEEIPVNTDSIKEDFHVPFLPLLRRISNQESKNLPDDVRKVVYPYIDQINDLVDTVEKLAQHLKSSHIRMALCHTDLHNWNLMQSKQQLMLIDWEGLKLAPVEADLMFLVDKPYYDIFLRIYKEIHGNFKLNPDALHFYQGRRKLEDIGEFLEQLLFDSLSQEERVVAINYLKEELRNIIR